MTRAVFSYPPRMLSALAAVADERQRQESLKAAGRFEFTCADPGMPDLLRLAALGEEFGEVCRAICDGSPPAELRQELVEVAAVAAAWVEALDREIAE